MFCLTCLIEDRWVRYFNKSRICAFGHIMPVLVVRGKK